MCGAAASVERLRASFDFVFMAVFMGSGSLPVTDPTESNYTLAAKEMLETGEYISPQIYGTDWFDKPILFYWELMAAFHFFGSTSLRLDSSRRFLPLWGCSELISSPNGSTIENGG